MLNTADFSSILQKKGIDFSTGVPDSLLKDFCAYVADNGNDIIDEEYNISEEEEKADWFVPMRQ